MFKSFSKATILATLMALGHAAELETKLAIEASTDVAAKAETSTSVTVNATGYRAITSSCGS